MIVRNLRFDTDSAAFLDVSEGGAVEVGDQSLLSSLVGHKRELDKNAGVWPQIWKTVSDTKGNEKQFSNPCSVIHPSIYPHF